MIITDIKKSKKGKILIYADNEYLLSLSPEVFVKSKLKKGTYIDEYVIKDITFDSNLYKAKEKALRLLSLRAHSKKELENKIKRSTDEKSASEAVLKMEELGLVNDTLFAKLYVGELYEKKYYAIKRIKYELMQKCISKDIIEQVLSEVEIDEESNALRFLENKYFDKLSDEKHKQRAIGALQRLGYGWSVINTVIKSME